MRPIRTARRAAVAALFLPLSLGAQGLDLTTHNNGIAIGDKPRVNGLRLNFRDRKLEEMNGINATIWSPYKPTKGRVTGLALGLPSTGAATVRGAMIGILGGGAEQSMTGVGIGGIGIGTGGDMTGVMIGGIGAGAGGNIKGITMGLIGAGGGGRMTGLQIGGIGVGGGGDLKGVSIGGIGAGSGGQITGLAIGGIGVGAASGIKGVGIGGIGVGSGGDITGLAVGVVGVGSGGTIKGLSIGGVGVGAPSLKGVAIAGIGAGGENVHAIVLTPGYFKVDARGRFDGGALASVNNVKGAQHGLTIGLFNYARELHGAQLGIINVSDNDGHRRILPIASVR